MKKTVVTILLGLTLCFSPFAVSCSPKSVLPKEEPCVYVPSQLGQADMPVGIYVGPTPVMKNEFTGTNTPSLITEKYYQLMKDAGINLVYGHNETGSDEDIQKSMDLCEQYDMGYLAFIHIAGFFREENGKIVCYEDYPEEEQERVKADFIKELDRYRHHPAFAGVKFCDEMGTDTFPALVSANKIFDELCPGKLFYTNLLGDRATAEMMKYAPYFADKKVTDDLELLRDGYEHYCESFLQEVSSPIISFDNYPIEATGVNQSFTRNINRVMKIAHENDVPFWNFIQAGKWDSTTVMPNRAELSWQIAMSLAYDCKGIQLFSFYTPFEFLSQEKDGIVRMAINSDGSVNEIYYDIVHVMNEVHAYDEYLMRAVWKGTMQSDHPSYAGYIYSAPMDSFCQVSGIESGEAQVLAGCYNYQGMPMLYLVNNSVTNSTSVTVEFSKNVKGKTVIAAAETKFSSEGKKYTLQLEPGQGGVMIIE